MSRPETVVVRCRPCGQANRINIGRMFQQHKCGRCHALIPQSEIHDVIVRAVVEPQIVEHPERIH